MAPDYEEGALGKITLQLNNNQQLEPVDTFLAF